MNASETAIPRVVLDTNIIFSRVLHELFGRLAREARLFDLIWSDKLLAEAKRTLIEKKPTTEPIAERWVGYLREAFPRGRVDISSLPGVVDLSTLTRDPEDQHVCALALAGDARLLITLDESFEREALLERGVAVVAPDAVLAQALEEQPALIRTILKRQAEAWGDRPLGQLLDALERAGAPDFVTGLRAVLDAQDR
jgi:predicted nucleic acid-binding protein